jgi:hypothetical protein
LNSAPKRASVGCVVVLLVAWLACLPLHVPAAMAVVELGGGLCGVLFGFCIAMVTRTRKPAIIYFWLGLAALTLWPVYSGWPYANPAAITVWPGGSTLLYSAFDVMRPGAFIVALVPPFALLGQHGPDT